MGKLAIKAGSVDVSLLVWVQDSASTTGDGKTGVAYNAAGLQAYYARPGAAASAIALTSQAVAGAHVDGGWIEVHSTYLPGLYRLDLPDAVCAAGARSAVVMVRGAAGMAPLVLELDLGAQVDAVAVGGTGQTGRDLGAGVLLTPGTAAGEVLLGSGKVTAGTVDDKAGYALSEAGVDAVFDEVVEGTLTARQALRVLLSFAAGKATGGGTATVTFRDLGDTKGRVTMTVDGNGDRSAVTVDGT